MTTLDRKKARKYKYESISHNAKELYDLTKEIQTSEYIHLRKIRTIKANLESLIIKMERQGKTRVQLQEQLDYAKTIDLTRTNEPKNNNYMEMKP